MVISGNNLVINGTTVEAADLTNVASITSDVQTQLNSKVPLISGSIIKTQSYSSGYGNDAATTMSSGTWNVININGTQKDPYFPSDNVNIRSFLKTRSGTHLRIRCSIPVYISHGDGGVGIRTRMCLSSTPSVYNYDNNYFTVGSLSNGAANTWGMAGYGGDSANMISFYYDTQFGNPDVLNHVGILYFFFQGYVFSSTDIGYFISYTQDNWYKCAYWTVEEYLI